MITTTSAGTAARIPAVVRKRLHNDYEREAYRAGRALCDAGYSARASRRLLVADGFAENIGSLANVAFSLAYLTPGVRGTGYRYGAGAVERRRSAARLRGLAILGDI